MLLMLHKQTAIPDPELSFEGRRRLSSQQSIQSFKESGDIFFSTIQHVSISTSLTRNLHDGSQEQPIQLIPTMFDMALAAAIDYCNATPAMPAALQKALWRPADEVC